MPIDKLDTIYQFYCCLVNRHENHKYRKHLYLLFATFSLPPSLQSVIEGCDNILNGMGSSWMIGVAVKAFLDVL